MNTDALDYTLPEDLIARVPAPNRTHSRLLRLSRSGDILGHHQFAEVPDLIPDNALLVFNNTRVMACRLYGKKPTGAAVELLLLRELATGRWRAMTRCSSKMRVGDTIELDAGETATIAAIHEDGERDVTFADTVDVPALMDQHGHMPLPPYMRRDDDASDRLRYQTVYADNLGAVAAPTAGLHFDDNLMTALSERGIQIAYLTLHVGMGTFKPIKADRVEDHPMHSEWYQLDDANAQCIAQAKADGRPIIAIGTTTVRCLESIWQKHNAILADSDDTQIYLYPPYTIQSCDGLITNFHLPKSTLLLLVGCFLPIEKLLGAYACAISEKYRFYSYGDAMLIM